MKHGTSSSAHVAGDSLQEPSVMKSGSPQSTKLRLINVLN